MKHRGIKYKLNVHKKLVKQAETQLLRCIILPKHQVLQNKTNSTMILNTVVQQAVGIL